MRSSTGGVSPNPVGFLSTHNALRESEDERIWVMVRELSGRKRHTSFLAFPFYDIEMVKRLLIRGAGLPPYTNIREIRLLHRGSELPNQKTLGALVNFEGPLVRVKFQWIFLDGVGTTGVRELGLRAPPHLQVVLADLELAFQRGVAPRLTLDGTGGTYLLFGTSSQQPLAVFKPLDEEPFAPRNPRGYLGTLGQRGFRTGVLSGEGCQREVAAFLLDAQYNRFSSVPETSKAEVCHPTLSYNCSTSTSNERVPYFKEGSLQEFVPNAQLCGDYDPGVFAISDAQRIAILDLIVLNMDRNDCNILVCPRDTKVTTSGDMTPSGKLSRFKLIPIDHGLILPDSLDIGDIDLVWYYWPQNKLPVGAAEIRHVLWLDPDRDALRLARKLEIRQDCLRTLRVAARVLQIGACMHLNVHQIASMMVRVGDFEMPSQMETLVKAALIQTFTIMNATSLTQQNRLPGRVVTDLHMARGSRSDAATSGSLPNEGGAEKTCVFSPRYYNSSDNDGTPSPEPSSLPPSRRHTGSRKSPLKVGRSDLLNTGERDAYDSNDCLGNRNDAAFQTLDCNTPLRHSSSSSSGTSFWSGDAEDSDSGDNSSDSTSSDDDSDAEEVYHNIDVVDGKSSSEYMSSDVDKDPKIQYQKGHRKPQIIRCSKITGVPLDPHYDVPETWKCRVHKRRPGPERNPNNRLRHSSPKGDKRNRIPSFAAADLALPGHRRRPTALGRRGPRPAGSSELTLSSAWSLIGSNKKRIYIDWDDPLFDKTFFECFESLIRRHIADTFPEWQNYPFNGAAVLRELAASRSTYHRRLASRVGVTVPEGSPSLETIAPGGSCPPISIAAPKMSFDNNFSTIRGSLPPSPVQSPTPAKRLLDQVPRHLIQEHNLDDRRSPAHLSPQQQEMAQVV